MTTELVGQGAGTRSKKVDKREVIIEVARTLFTTVGYETTTIADVAKKAGVAVGTVYLYFKNKPELLDAVCGNWETQFVKYMTDLDLQGVPHHLRTRPIVEACFRMCEDQTDTVQLMGMQPQLMGHNDYDKGREDGLVHQTIKAFFDEAVAAEAFRPMDTKAAAVIAFGMVHSALHQCFDIDGGKSRELYIDILVDALGRWLVRPELLAQMPS